MQCQGCHPTHVSAIDPPRSPAIHRRPDWSSTLRWNGGPSQPEPRHLRKCYANLGGILHTGELESPLDFSARLWYDRRDLVTLP